MKTYTGKQITKKHIQQVLRTLDATDIFRLYHIIYGGKVERMKVYHFIKEYAPTYHIARAAWDIAFSNLNQTEKGISIRRSIEWRKQNQKHIVMEELRKELARPQDNYTKRPIMGHTHLYFASPVYQHEDYNKWRAIPIKGNERFCEVICKLADKYFPLIND